MVSVIRVFLQCKIHSEVARSFNIGAKSFFRIVEAPRILSFYPFHKGDVPFHKTHMTDNSCISSHNFSESQELYVTSCRTEFVSEDKCISPSSHRITDLQWGRRQGGGILYNAMCHIEPNCAMLVFPI